MSKKTAAVLGLIMVMVLALSGLYFSGWFSKEERTAAVAPTDETLAPDFVLKNLDGQDVRLTHYRGQAVVLIFGTTWCGYCRAEIPRFKEIHERYAPKGLVVLYIDIGESREKAAAFAEKYRLPYATLLDSEGRVAQDYGVAGVPTRVLIDCDGRIICWNCRSFDALLDRQFKASADKR